jgi:hypothetical protein
MYNLLESAIKDEHNKEFTFFLQGDLCQMSSQRSFLNSRGVETKQNNVYPCVRSCDISKALGLIWESKTEGWWHYMDEYIQHSICTKDEYIAYLSRFKS